MSEAVKPCIKCGAADRYRSGDCKPCAREFARKYREADPQRHRDSSRKWATANRDRVRENNSNWYKANKDWAAEQNRNWQKVNPEKRKVINQNRRAKVRGSGGKLSPNIVQTLMALQKGKCACCDKSLSKGHHLDHIIPIALGGMNDDSNVQLLTPKCNLSKGAKHPVDYMRSKGKLI